MGIDRKVLIDNLNHNDVKIRLSSLKSLMAGIESGEIKKPERGTDVNNHIHTFYSFSPYSPAKAVWMAYNAGLESAGIMDHDSISGAREFIEAGITAGVSTTIGIEFRADFSKTPLAGRRFNNPDQCSIAYITIHGIPHTQTDRVKNFLAPYQALRNTRNRRMIDKINSIMDTFNIRLDYDIDIVPISKSCEGGSITERHISFALSKKLVASTGKGENLVSFLKNQMKLEIPRKIEAYLLDADNPFYEYDLLGLLKGGMTGRFYIDAKEECPDIKEILEFSKSIGAISAYPYLGDVKNSVTGDKIDQEFEDGYITLLFTVIKELGFEAVSYMPSRNTMEQLEVVRKLCEKHDLMQISGEDINSPRQSFVCSALKSDTFKNLVDSTWALIGHEREASLDMGRGMFSGETVSRYPDLRERIRVYSELGKG